MIVQSRRSFIRGAVATLFAAPAIVRAGSLMPVKAIPELNEAAIEDFIYRQHWTHIALGYSITRKAIDKNLYGGSFEYSLVPPREVVWISPREMVWTSC